MQVYANSLYSPYYGYDVEDNSAPTKNSNNPKKIVNTPVNGKIDNAFYQGTTGDCALLSTIYSISQTEEGAKDIKDSVKFTKNSNDERTGYSVTFKGLKNQNNTYNVTFADLEKAQKSGKYCTGDSDMTLFELTIEQALKNPKDEYLKHLIEGYSDGKSKNTLDGVNPACVSYLLTGETADWYTKSKQENGIVSRFNTNQGHNYKLTDNKNREFQFKDNGYYSLASDGENIFLKDIETGIPYTFNGKDFQDIVSIPDRTSDMEAIKEAFEKLEQDKNSVSIIFTVNKETKDNKNTVIKPNGDTTPLSTSAHAYGVKSVKDGVVTFINPHSSGQEVQCTLESLLNLTSFDCFAIDFSTDLESNKNIFAGN